MKKDHIKNKIGWIVEKELSGVPLHTGKSDKIFHCSCGNIFLVKNALDTLYMISIRCDKCHNNFFLSSNLFAYKQASIYIDSLSFKYEYSKSEDKWSISISVKLPFYDNTIQKIIYKYTSIYYMQSAINKEIIYCSFDIVLHPDMEEWIKTKTTKLLLDYILENLPANFTFIDHKLVRQIERKNVLLALKTTLDILKNKNTNLIMKPILEDLIHNSFAPFKIKEKHFYKPIADYISNFSSKKSVKKLIYLHILNSFKKDRTYNMVADFIICRVFDDENIICALLKDNVLKDNIFYFYLIPKTKNLYYQKIIQFMKWLKTLHSEISIAKTMKSDHQAWRDIFMMIQSLSLKIIALNFTKIPINSQYLHNEILRIKDISELSKSEDENIMFKHETFALYSATQYGGLKFKLPRDTKTLKYWSLLLQNCMNGYAINIQSGISIIYGVFRGDKLLYAIEINGDMIIQALGINNTNIPKNDMDIINLWFQEYLQNYNKYYIPVSITKINNIIEKRARLIEFPRIIRRR